MSNWILACPHCGQALHSDDQQHWSCASGHSFDRARQGYLHLLPVQHKRSKQPGDSSDMVQARRRLLDSGLYQPIAEQLAQQLQKPQSGDIHQLADIGCGEGYYTQAMAEQLPQAQVYGIDISKDAVKAAARRHPNIAWLVASGAHLPLLPGQLDMITCLFTRLMPAQFAQALKADGEVIILSTGEQHLLELRQRLYEQVRASGFDPQSHMAEHFDLHSKQRIHYQTTVPQALIGDLIMMTPHYWRCSAEARDALCQAGDLDVSIDVWLHRFRRHTA